MVPRSIMSLDGTPKLMLVRPTGVLTGVLANSELGEGKAAILAENNSPFVVLREAAGAVGGSVAAVISLMALLGVLRL